MRNRGSEGGPPATQVVLSQGQAQGLPDANPQHEERARKEGIAFVEGGNEGNEDPASTCGEDAHSGMHSHERAHMREKKESGGGTISERLAFVQRKATATATTTNRMEEQEEHTSPGRETTRKKEKLDLAAAGGQ